jgi:hypothetical protein
LIDKRAMTFVVPVNDDALFRANFLASPLFEGIHPYEILVQKGFNSASTAYNDAMERASNDLMVFCHQDIVLPGEWVTELGKALDYLEKKDPAWGVLGCAGVTNRGEAHGFVYCTSNEKFVGAPFEAPEPVQTLDEIVLILRKSTGLRFDSSLPSFHFYGTDICIRAAAAGRQCYAIPAFCLHNSGPTVLFPKDFFKCYRHIKKRWKDMLPIHTTCVEIIRSDVWASLKYNYVRRFKYFLLKALGRDIKKIDRSEKPLELLKLVTDRSVKPEKPGGPE